MFHPSCTAVAADTTTEWAIVHVAPSFREYVECLADGQDRLDPSAYTGLGIIPVKGMCGREALAAYCHALSFRWMIAGL